MKYQYNSPPNWPAPPIGWVPPSGWVPPQDWPPAPEGWPFWTEVGASPAQSSVPEARPDSQAYATVANSVASENASDDRESLEAKKREISIFGARGKARELTEEVEHLRRELVRMGAMDLLEIEEAVATGRELLASERLRAQESLKSERSIAESEIAAQRYSAQEAVSSERLELEREIRSTREALTKERLASQEELSKLRTESVNRISDEIASLESRRAAVSANLAQLESRAHQLSAEVVELEEAAILQEVGIYNYQHPLENAEGYKARLVALQVHIKEAAKVGGGAIEASTSWQVNGSLREGKKMVTDFSKLMLRAYNAEADSLVRGLKPHRLAASVERLEKTAITIEKLGKSMSIRVSTRYHQMRVDELKLTADYLAKLEAEKERDREAREALREQRKVEQEMARERDRLQKEHAHYENAMRALVVKGDLEGAERLQAQLDDVARAIEDVDYRVANQKAGYVYVISNIGAFGEQMIKVGLTRRLEPMDRVRELGDASVPFRFDVHALHFSKDAVEVEAEMHRRLAHCRVNKVNSRKEFFYATPQEALDQLRELTGDVLSFVELPEALEFRQSQNAS